MKKIFSLILLFLGVGSLVLAQDCALYIPGTVGTELQYKNTTVKGKDMGGYSQKLLSIKEQGGETVYEMLQSYWEAKDQNNIIKQDTIRFRCKDNVFHIDMDQYLNQDQMKAFKDMDVTVTTEDVIYPPNLSPGQSLKDGSVTIKVEGGMMNINMTTNIINRKVEAKESKTTAAGTFDCYRISEDIQSKMGFVNVKLHNVIWLSKDIGTIRTESYDKKGKLHGITELVKIVK